MNINQLINQSIFYIYYTGLSEPLPGSKNFIEYFSNQFSICTYYKCIEFISHIKDLAKLHKISHASGLQFWSCENMLRKTADLEARTARCAEVLPLDAFIMISVCMLSDNIRPSDARAVSFNCTICVNPSLQIEQASEPYIS
ncbi:hypothetical protein ACJIZ3_012974 [Penstemon smallii]|uniref:Uncharacterized protein n=1 Tax=Penstemon smallii TaxID=265156 RepID=A0ABD3US55_9LAMI